MSAAGQSLLRVTVVAAALATAAAGALAFRLEDWPLYLTYVVLGVSLSRFSVEVLPTLRLPLPELAVNIGFLYIAGPPVILLAAFFLPASLMQFLHWALPDRLRARMGPLIDDRSSAAMRFRRAVPGGGVAPRSAVAADWSMVPLGLGVRWAVAAAIAGDTLPAFDPLAMLAGEVAGYSTWTILSTLPILTFNWRDLMLRALPADVTHSQSGLRMHHLRQDLGLVMIPTLTPFVFLIAYGYRAQGLAGAVVWSVASLGVHFLLGRLTERRIVVERQNLQLAELNRELEHRERLSAIGKMSSIVSHQTLQHLGVIGIHADLIRNLAPQPDASAALARAHDSARAIEGALGDVNRVLTDLLVFSRDLRLNLYEHSIARIVADCVEDCRAEATAVSVTLRQDSPASDLLATVDKLKVKQALTNLLRNAVEASPAQGEVTIEVAARDLEVEIAIADRGPGVPERDREAIFLPFYTTKERGTGLGLAIAREFTVAHAGRLWSEPRGDGTGARFVLRLPLSPP